MPQIPARFFPFAALLIALLPFSGCGSSKNPNIVTDFELGTNLSGTFAQVTTTQSLQQGQVTQLATQSKNYKGVVIFPTVTWSSSNSSVASVSPTGEVCAGTWDANFVNCTPGPVGTATITATVPGGKTATLAFNIHARIARVVLSPTQSACSSQTQTVQYTFQAFDPANNDITSQVGTPTYTANDTTVATIDANGLATAKNSGATTITAAVGGVVSPPATFITCPPAQIVLHKNGDPNGTNTFDFPLALNASATLIADAYDTHGQLITGLGITILSNQPAAVAANGVTITGTDVGFATLIAACTPPACNPGNGLNVPGAGVPIYSNLVTSEVTGTAATTTVYATGINDASGNATNKTLLPISTATGTPGTAITLPDVPNSMRISPRGDTLYVGTPTALAVVSTSANTVNNVSSVPGKVLAVSPSGTQVVTFDFSNSRLLFYDSSATTVTQLQATVTQASDAAFSPDGFKLFIAADNKIYEFNTRTLTRSTTFPSAPTSVTALPQGVAAYAAPYNAGNSQIASIATCNNSLLTTPNVALPTLLRASPDGTELIGVNNSAWITIPYTVNSSSCPPSLTDGAGVNTFGYAGPAPTSLYVSPTRNLAFATSASATPSTSVPFLNIASSVSGTAALANGATGIFTTGGFTLDGTSFWVGVTGGTNGNSVHRFDTSSATINDAGAVSLPFSPDFVVVKP